MSDEEQSQVDMYMQVIAEMLVTTAGFDYTEWARRFESQTYNPDWVNEVWHAGVVKYWEKEIFNDFIGHLKTASGYDDDLANLPGHGYEGDTE